MTGCSICGEPHPHETHHHNERRGDNDPDNLRPVHRRCHMHHHDNDRAVDHRTERRYGPKQPATAASDPF